MSKRVEASPVLGVCSCLTRRPELLMATEQELARTFGEVAMKSLPFRFDTSDYYREEMGAGLLRTWYCFSTLWRAEQLPRYRTKTGRIEEQLADAGKRRVNLDPGYLDHGKLVLASLKEAPDKIYMGDGVWAHTCLRYGEGSFTAPDHSFPDFRDGRFNDFMSEARALYKSLLQQSRQRAD